MGGYKESYFISPFGEIIRTPTTHIATVISNPEKFGFNRDIIDFIYKQYNERLGQEGKAREQILMSLFDNGWIRIRRYGDAFWSINVNSLTSRIRSFLNKWAKAMLSGKFGFKEEDKTMKVKIDQRGTKPLISDISSIANSKSFVVEDSEVLTIKNIEDLEDRPLISEAEKIMRMMKYLENNE